MDLFLFIYLHKVFLNQIERNNDYKQHRTILEIYIINEHLPEKSVPTSTPQQQIKENIACGEEVRTQGSIAYAEHPS